LIGFICAWHSTCVGAPARDKHVAAREGEGDGE
jgi:hypothetical protein